MADIAREALRALTIYQPWATLIVAGLKPYEFRGYPAPRFVRAHRIAIHAGARPVKKAEVEDLLKRLRTQGDEWTTALVVEPAIKLLDRVHLSPGMLPLSSILGTGTLGEPIRAERIPGLDAAVVADSDRVDHGMWAWPLLDIERFAVPVPARGAQGLWRWRREGGDG